MCKAAAWDGLKWFEAQDIPQLNTSKGRRIGDAIWRAQMRSQIGPCRHAGEIMIDLLKACEHVSRQRLASRGARGDYPIHVVAASLANIWVQAQASLQRVCVKRALAATRDSCRVTLCRRRPMACLQRPNASTLRTFPTGSLRDTCGRPEL